ncbi:uncharacterized protein [Medicago truncatula]|uniref:uncharacterized protein n=1 Tax=Medicago truncatula TaxID=3880 RepID=UPI000D2F3B07|nr:uncharacterized protein LOC25485598 [Medicago truncatula]
MDTKLESNLNAIFSTVNMYLESRVVNAINGDRSKGSVPSDAQIVAESSFRSISWRFRTRILKALCLAISSTSKNRTDSIPTEHTSLFPDEVLKNMPHIQEGELSFYATRGWGLHFRILSEWF